MSRGGSRKDMRWKDRKDWKDCSRSGEGFGRYGKDIGRIVELRVSLWTKVRVTLGGQRPTPPGWKIFEKFLKKKKITIFFTKNFKRQGLCPSKSKTPPTFGLRHAKKHATCMLRPSEKEWNVQLLPPTF